jgi:tRNA (cmo5U34)-methyltransferase
LSEKDTLYAQGLPHADFVFDDRVVAVFPDMINRSVPGYATIISMIGTLAAEYVQADSNCYDLGASLGAATLSMRRNIQQAGCRIIAVDNSQSMVSGFQDIMKNEDSGVPVDIRCEDILETEIHEASMVVTNFTLQFVTPEHRDTLVRKIFNGMKPGGILVLSEKIRFEDTALNELFIDMHHRFKEQQGYSKLEISRKRAALEKVLIPETVGRHKQRLQEAGFQGL